MLVFLEKARSVEGVVNGTYTIVLGKHVQLTLLPPRYQLSGHRKHLSRPYYKGRKVERIAVGYTKEGNPVQCNI